MGKRLLICLISLLCMGTFCTVAFAKLLPLSPQGQQTEEMYMEMLQGFWAEAKQEPDACAHYEKAFAYDSQNKYIRRQMLICALEQNQLDQADQYADFIKQEPHDSDDLSVYAFYQWRKGDVAQAQAYYEKALQQTPDDSRALYQYILLLSSFDLDRAVHEMQSRKEALPDLAAALDYETGNLYLRQKQWDKALDYYQRALDSRPNYAEPRLARAEVYEKTSRFFLMMHELEALEKIGYESASMYARMGSFYVLVKDEPKAKNYFLKAKQLEPSNDVAGYFLALQAEQEKDWQAAAEYLQQTAGYPKDAAKWLQVSFYQQQAGDMQGALETLRQAYERFDKNVEIGYFYALLLQDMGKYRQAIRVLQGVLETNPAYEQARLAYAFALEGDKRYKQMEEQVKLILTQNPANAAAYNLLGFSLADRNIRLEEAQRAITQALALQPTDAAFIDSLAWLYYRQGNYKQALALLTSLDKGFVQQNPDVMYHLAATYAALGYREQAMEYLQRIDDSNKPAAKLLKKLKRSGVNKQ